MASTRAVVPVHLRIAVGLDGAAALTDLSPPTIARLVKDGVLARVPGTDRVIIARIELDRWVASGRPGAHEAAGR
ncbi:MAG: helix-turn-helix domain-containing protein [Ilumatobacteraceae bacterium]